MIYRFFRTTSFFWLIAIAFAASLAGCKMDTGEASMQADEQVTGILDATWQDSFGTRDANLLNDPVAAAVQNNLIVEQVRQSKKLTLAQAVQIAITASPEYQTERENLYLTALDQTDAEHLYELTPFANLTAGQGGVRGTSNRSGRGFENEIRGGSATAGINKLLATGAVTTMDLTLGSFDIVSGNYRSGMVSIFQAAITQPLLRGSDRVVVLETLTQAQQNTLYQIRSFNRYRKTFYVSVVNEYYRLIESSLRVRYSAKNVETLKTLLGKMETLSQAGRVPKFDLERARQEILQAAEEYSQIRRDHREMLDVYKHRLLIAQNAQFEPDINEWQAMESFALRELKIDEEKALEAAFSARLDLANAFDQVEDARRHVVVAADALGADLNLVGLAAPASSRRFTFGAEPGDIERTQSRYELSLRADLPLDRVAERNNYKRTMISLMQAQRAHQQFSSQVEMEVRKAWRDMAEAKERMEIQKRGRDLASERLGKTLRLLEYGRTNVPDVLDAQEDYFAAVDGYATAITDFAAAKMNFLRDTEILWITPDGQYEQRMIAGQK